MNDRLYKTSVRLRHSHSRAWLCFRNGSSFFHLTLSIYPSGLYDGAQNARSATGATCMAGGAPRDVDMERRASLPSARRGAISRLLARGCDSAMTGDTCPRSEVAKARKESPSDAARAAACSRLLAVDAAASAYVCVRLVRRRGCLQQQQQWRRRTPNAAATSC